MCEVIKYRSHDLELRPHRRLRAVKERTRESRVLERSRLAKGLDDVLVARPRRGRREVGWFGGEVRIGEAKEDGCVTVWRAGRVEHRGV